MSTKRLVFAAAAAATLALAGPAAAADRTVQITPAAPTATWAGATTVGANASWFADGTQGQKTGACTKDATTYCDDTIIKVGDFENHDEQGATILFRMEGFEQYEDFDLRISRLDEQGNPSELVSPVSGGCPDTDGNGPFSAAIGTFMGDYESCTVAGVAPGESFLMQVVYFAVPMGSYDGSAKITQLPEPLPPEEE